MTHRFSHYVPMFLGTLLTTITPAFAQDTPSTNLTVTLTGLANDDGKVVALLYAKDPIGEEVARTSVGNIKGQKATLTVNNLDDGRYALVIYHDENDNGVLDHFLGHIPSESMAFSGTYTMSLFSGKPTFETLSFDFSEGKRTQVLAF